MNIKFESNLDYQLDAISSTIALFKGQPREDELFPQFMEGGVYPNRFSLTDEQILANLQHVQMDNNLPVSEKLDGRRFSVEMETGTGKTYVYLRTILELNARYGLRKFIIIVPSIAIKEGVLKTLGITTTHFKQIYENPSYNFYEYDSSRINTIRHFAKSNCVEVIVMTLDSFNKDTNVMNQAIDKLGGQRPIDFVSRTRPVVILDEPQNMESENARKAIQGLDPLFELRYSATHRQYYNLIYRLTPIDAYNKKLVKRIEVFSVTKEGDYNGAFVKCEDITLEKSGLRAKVQAFKRQGSGHKLATITIKNGDDLSEKTGYGEYIGFRAIALNASAPKYIEFSNGIKLTAGQAAGDDKKSIMRAQIRHTIEEHFQKQERLRPYGIKVLSLFFIDRVANYLDKDGFIRATFIEEFEALKKNYPAFRDIDVNKVHDGYFSTYKTERSMEEDIEAFNKIMRNKEQLLSMDEPVQFIFSHSALREGWDNPNVFNICTLNETVSEMKKRQEMGRGLRLPVNQAGERFRDVDLNVLTVFANESYTDYVNKLQQEYVDEYGIMGVPPPPGNTKKQKTVLLKKGFRLNPEFKELWSKISGKTKYSVRFDSSRLIDECVQRSENIRLEPIKLRLEKVALDYHDTGIETVYVGERDLDYDADYPLPNLVESISRETMLTRRSVVEILSRMRNLEQCYNNPKDFIEKVSTIIKERMNAFLIDGIRYVELHDFWNMELFKDALKSYENVTVPATKSIYDAIEVDSEGERGFATEMENDSRVKLFIKLPSWFIVPTPIGTYNPDWAVVMEIKDINGQPKETLYLVRETKFVTNLENLRPSEEGKIKCAKAHFDTLKVNFKEVTSYRELV